MFNSSVLLTVSNCHEITSDKMVGPQVRCFLHCTCFDFTESSCENIIFYSLFVRIYKNADYRAALRDLVQSYDEQKFMSPRLLSFILGRPSTGLYSVHKFWLLGPTL